MKNILYLITLILTFPSPVFSQEDLPTDELTPTPLIVEQEPLTGINFSISPNVINLVTKPKETVSTEIKIRNNNNFIEYLDVNLAKFEAATGGRTPTILDFLPEDDYQSWVSFSQEQFSLTANESKTIKVTVSPPADAALGYYYAVIFNRLKEKEAEGQQAVIAGAPAALVLLEVETPNTVRELQLIDFKTDKKFYEYLPVEFKATVKNSGNIHIAPWGDIFIDQGRKKEIAIIRINDTRSNILPASERDYETSWEDGFIVRVPKKDNGVLATDKNNQPVWEVKWDLDKANKFRVGKYTAHLLMVYDDGQRDIPMEAVASFWVVPWTLIGILIGLILFIRFFKFNWFLKPFMLFKKKSKTTNK